MPDPNSHHPDMFRHDETVGLRLELARVKDQRDAFQAALRKEVLDVMRYNVAEIQAQLTLGGNALEASKDGQLVTYSDYARLKAEVERLRKAGDAMARIIAPPTHGTGEWDGEWEAWNAAKEGKQ